MTALLTAAVVITGTLAPAAPGVLEDVQDRRLHYGWGLTEAAPEGAVLLALDSCNWLGYSGTMWVQGAGWQSVSVVDCCGQVGCLAGKGLAADVSQEELGHQEAVIWLWPSERNTDVEEAQCQN